MAAAGFGPDNQPSNLQILASCHSLKDKEEFNAAGWKTARVIDEPEERTADEVLCPFDLAKRRGVKVYHLNIGQPDLETPPAMRAKLAQAPSTFAYSPSAPFIVAGTLNLLLLAYVPKLTPFSETWIVIIMAASLVVTAPLAWWIGRRRLPGAVERKIVAEPSPLAKEPTRPID